MCALKQLEWALRRTMQLVSPDAGIGHFNTVLGNLSLHRHVALHLQAHRRTGESSKNEHGTMYTLPPQ